MLLHLMDRVGVDPRQTLMIGDTTHDLDLARNAGVAAVAVAYGAHDHEGLAAGAPLATVHSVRELATWLATARMTAPSTHGAPARGPRVRRYALSPALSP